MTTHDAQPEDNSSEPVEPKVEFMSPARGTYAASLDTEDTLKQYERFLDPDRGSMPDIDCNFVDGDRKRAETKEYLKERYSNPEQKNAESSVLDGYSDKEDIIRKAREAGVTRLAPGEWLDRSTKDEPLFR